MIKMETGDGPLRRFWAEGLHFRPDQEGFISTKM